MKQQWIVFVAVAFHFTDYFVLSYLMIRIPFVSVSLNRSPRLSMYLGSVTSQGEWCTTPGIFFPPIVTCFLMTLFASSRAVTATLALFPTSLLQKSRLPWVRLKICETRKTKLFLSYAFVFVFVHLYFVLTLFFVKKIQWHSYVSDLKINSTGIQFFLCRNVLFSTW